MSSSPLPPPVPLPRRKSSPWRIAASIAAILGAIGLGLFLYLFLIGGLLTAGYWAHWNSAPGAWHTLKAKQTPSDSQIAGIYRASDPADKAVWVDGEPYVFDTTATVTLTADHRYRAIHYPVFDRNNKLACLVTDTGSWLTFENLGDAAIAFNSDHKGTVERSMAAPLSPQQIAGYRKNDTGRYGPAEADYERANAEDRLWFDTIVTYNACSSTPMAPAQPDDASLLSLTELPNVIPREGVFARQSGTLAFYSNRVEVPRDGLKIEQFLYRRIQP